LIGHLDHVIENFQQMNCFVAIHNTHAGIKSISDIKEYFAGRVGDIVGNHGLDISAWEDGLMHGKNPFNLNSKHFKKCKYQCKINNCNIRMTKMRTIS
jgi:hypothetical protein